MKAIWSLLFFIIIFATGYEVCYYNPMSPTILVASVLRNKTHALPYYLSYLENLKYPKKKMSLWIQSEDHTDNSIEIIREWINNEDENYNSTKVILDEILHSFSDEKDSADSTNDRYTHMIDLRQQMNYARNISTDCAFILDAAVFFTNPNILIDSIDKGKTVVALMLKSCLCSAIAKSHEVLLDICNDKIHGIIMDLSRSNDTLDVDFKKLTNIEFEIIPYNAEILLTNKLKKFVEYPKKDTLGMDSIFLISLMRVMERRLRMENAFNELGIDVQTVDAIDSKELTETILIQRGVRMLPQYTGIPGKRPMNMGEFGCYLSHYSIWQTMLQNNIEKVIIFEDDVHFKPNFRRQFNLVMNDLQKLNGDWDLVFLGRRALYKSQETCVKDSKYLVHADHSHGTHGYILSQRGARKLLRPDPLHLVVPVDEYFAILSDQHRNDYYKSYFKERNFITLSAEPTLLTDMEAIIPNYPSTITGTTIVRSHEIVGDFENNSST